MYKNVLKCLSCISAFGQTILSLDTDLALYGWLNFWDRSASYFCHVSSGQTPHNWSSSSGMLKLDFRSVEVIYYCTWMQHPPLNEVVFHCGATDSWLNRQTVRQKTWFCMPVFMPISLYFGFLPVCVFVCLVYLYVCLCACLSVCLSVCHQCTLLIQNIWRDGLSAFMQLISLIALPRKEEEPFNK